MLKLRPARAEDLDDLARIGLASWRTSIGLLVNPSIIAKVEGSNPFIPFVSELAERLVIAELNNQLAGFAGRENQDHTISDLWVSPEFAGKGIGRSLIRKLEEDIAYEGYRAAHIHVAAENKRALSLYQHLGYEVFWRGKLYDEILEIPLEKCHLEKQLRP